MAINPVNRSLIKKSLQAATCLFLFTSCFLSQLSAQKYICRNGKVYFISETPVINIDAESNQAGSIIDFSSGQVAAAVPLKSFRFRLALAQDHFNEDYVESDKYPKSTFKGILQNFDPVVFSSDTVVELKVKGEIFLHGVSKTIETTAKLIAKNNAIIATCNFSILLSDFDIHIPAAVKDKVSQIIPINLYFEYQPFK